MQKGKSQWLVIFLLFAIFILMLLKVSLIPFGKCFVNFASDFLYIFFSGNVSRFPFVIACSSEIHFFLAKLLSFFSLFRHNSASTLWKALIKVKIFILLFILKSFLFSFSFCRERVRHCGVNGWVSCMLMKLSRSFIKWIFLFVLLTFFNLNLQIYFWPSIKRHKSI